MQRVTVTLDEELVAEVDALMHERGYLHRIRPAWARWCMSTIMPLVSCPSA